MLYCTMTQYTITRYTSRRSWRWSAPARCPTPSAASTRSIWGFCYTFTSYYFKHNIEFQHRH